jgi:TonB-dependent receptor
MFKINALPVKYIVALMTLLGVVFITDSIDLKAQDKGVITGAVVDQKTGDPLIGLRVVVKGQPLGAVSSVDGTYRINNVPVGSHTIQFSYVGYAKLEIENVEVKPGEIVKVDATMAEQQITTDEVVVVAKKLQNTEATLLKERQKAQSVSDAISAEDITRGGAGDAAEAIKKVTGATTVGGKHVYIRGLGERYSSTQLNGANLPSADPDKKSVHLDLFPSDMIENITTIKTATPDKPGDFTGGTVDIRTKSFPEKFRANISLSGDYNTNTTANEMLSYAGSATDWLGYDDGKRGIPSLLNNADIPSKTDANRITNPDGTVNENAILLDQQSKAFDRVFAPNTQNAPVNMGLGISVGDQFQLFKNAFGYNASFSYGRKYNSYDNGIVGLWSQAGTGSKELTREYYANTQSGSDEVAWGGMVNMSYELSSHNRISFTTVINQNGNLEAVYQDAYDEYYHKYRETRVLHYVERSLNSYQLNGEHKLSFFLGSAFDWKFSYAGNSQNEPYYRTFDNEYRIVDEQTGERSYSMPRSDNNAYPSIYYRDLTEDLMGFSSNLEVPFKESAGLDLKLKTGLLYDYKTRDFVESRYIYEYGSDDVSYLYDGNPNEFMANNTGIIGQNEQYNRNVIGMYLQDRTQPRGTYDGKQEILATYLMIDWFMLDDLRIVGGARYETTNMVTTSADTTVGQGKIDEQDLLPSVNLTYMLADNMNLRLAYGKTLARPTFREIAPFRIYLPVEHRTFNGNDSLQRTLIDNLDLRWEWFTNPGEIISIGGFYKKFENPIEIAIISSNGEIQPVNVGDATLYGLEIEFRKNLVDLTSILNGFHFGTNLTLVHSEVKLPELEYQTRKALDPSTSTTRELQGQSPYIVNLDLSYMDWDNGWDANLHFNVFGKRLMEVGDGTPDYYQHAKPELSFVISKKFFNAFKVKLSAKNLLDSKYYIASTFNGADYVQKEYTLGRSISLGFSYSIDQ